MRSRLELYGFNVQTMFIGGPPHSGGFMQIVFPFDARLKFISLGPRLQTGGATIFPRLWLDLVSIGAILLDKVPVIQAVSGPNIFAQIDQTRFIFTPGAPASIDIPGGLKLSAGVPLQIEVVCLDGVLGDVLETKLILGIERYERSVELDQ